MRVWRRVGMESRERWMEGRGERTGEKRGQDRTGQDRRGEGREERRGLRLSAGGGCLAQAGRRAFDIRAVT